MNLKQAAIVVAVLVGPMLLTALMTFRRDYYCWKCGKRRPEKDTVFCKECLKHSLD